MESCKKTINTKQENSTKEIITEIPLSDIFPYKNYPFKVQDDKAMVEMAESVAQCGILVPGVVRPCENGYELISGHRRKRACEIAGIASMPVIVRNLNDCEAVFAMVDSNLHREELLFSEKARAYKMKLEAVKRSAGRPPDNNLKDINRGKKSYEIVGEQLGESKNQIFRYIRLTELINGLMEMVDDKKIAFNPAVELSYLKKDEQQFLLETMISEEATPSLSQAQRMKKLSQNGNLNEHTIFSIITEVKKENLKIVITGEYLKKYFPKSFTPRQMEETIIGLLEKHFKSKKGGDLLATQK